VRKPNEPGGRLSVANVHPIKMGSNTRLHVLIALETTMRTLWRSSGISNTLLPPVASGKADISHAGSR